MTTLATFLNELAGADKLTAVQLDNLERLFDAIDHCNVPAVFELRDALQKVSQSGLPLWDRASEMICLLRPFDPNGRLH